jgi:hypothetical protein
MSLNAGGQSSNVGLLPPSDSEDDDDEDNQPTRSRQPEPRGQPKTAGLMPPSDSEDDEDDDDGEPEYFKQPVVKKK